MIRGGSHGVYMTHKDIQARAGGYWWYVAGFSTVTNAPVINKAPFLVIQPVEVPSELWHASVIPKPHREATAVVPFQHTWLANVGRGGRRQGFGNINLSTQLVQLEIERARWLT